MAMNDTNYSVSGQDIISDSGLIYSPKRWEDNELIERIEMNNIEQGIQIALESRSELKRIAGEYLQGITDYYSNTISPALDELNQTIGGLSKRITTEVNQNLTQNTQNIIDSFRNLLGTNYVPNDAVLPLTLPNTINTVDSRITEIYNAVFGNGSSNNITQLQTGLNNLNTYVRGETNPNSLVNQIIALQNELGGGESGTSFKEKIENALGRPLEPTAEKIAEDANVNSSLLELIENLQGVLGLSSSAEGEPSLIEKIESALGRPLTPTEEQIQADELIDDSLLDLIKGIRGTLGMSGGTDEGENSNLIEKINAVVTVLYGNNSPENYDLGNNYTLARVLDDLYGTLVEDSSTGEFSRSDDPLIEKLKNLPTSINTLNTKVSGLEADRSSYIRNGSEQATKWDMVANSAYINADWKKFEAEDETYLRLIRKDIDWPATVADLANETVNTYIPLPKGGSGGGASGGGTAIVTRITDSTVQILVGKSCYLRYRLEARQNDGALVSAASTATWLVGGVQVATSEALNITSNEDTTTINKFDISPYLSVGSNNITLQIAAETGGDTPTIVRRTWVVRVINFSLIWNYNEETVFDNGIISLEWVPYGANINKTTHIYIDRGTDHEIYLTRTTSQSGITQIYTFEHNLSHGTHTCEMFLTATIDNINETTDSQFHDIIILEPSNITPIISSSPLIENMKKDQDGNFIKNEEGIFIQEMEQYDTIEIPIVIYTPNSTLTNNVILKVDGVIKDTWDNVDRKLHYWNYSASTTGTKILTISVGEVTKTIIIEVINISIGNAEVEGYDFKIKASDIISNTILQNNSLLTFSNNFDWINGGIKSERDINNNIQQYICIKAGTTMTVNKKIFSTSLDNGLNFKIIFKITNCSDYDTKFLTCYSDGIGLQMFAHESIFKASDTTLPAIKYNENSYIEMEFEAYKKTDTPRYMFCWIDGVMSAVRVCNQDTVFKQTTESNIIIGSSNCDVYIYLIKTYYKPLNISEHIANFIADAPNATTMKARYNRNNILNKETGEIDQEELYKAAPDCRIWLYDIARMPVDKDTPTLVYNFKQRWKNDKTGYFDNLQATNATLLIQGTSSVGYRKGAANTDINFYDINAEALKTENGFLTPTLISGNGDNLLSDSLPYKGLKLTETSIPITYANMKVNFASCEQVNNMCNAAWYQNFQPYPSLSPRDCMEFVMGVQFIKDRGEREPQNEEPLFKDRDKNAFHMYSISNLGTSKNNTHLFHSENECCIEVKDNTTAGQRMTAWPETFDWTKGAGKDQSYGMRYPSKPTDQIKAGWERFVRWMASSDPCPYDPEFHVNGYTNEPLAQPETYKPYTFRGHKREGLQVLKGVTINKYAGTYTTDCFERRMAKMLSECEDYMAMDSVVYHFCYIERHSMVDNVAKNTFWSAAKTNQYINGIEQENTEGYWIWDLSKNYDNDTSDGNNNDGKLVLDYGNETDSSIEGKMVFNAPTSVWLNFIQKLEDACQVMYRNREGATSKDKKYSNAWDSVAYHTFLTEQQQKIPERVWNECYWYDYLRTYENGINESWLAMLDGGQKIHQRAHFEKFQGMYLASKYESAESSTDFITIRSYTPRITEDMSEENKELIRKTLIAVPSKSEFTLTSYNNCYFTVYAGDERLHKKAIKGQQVTFTFKNPDGTYLGLDDTIIKVYTASMIHEISDLAQLYPGAANLSNAYRVKTIKLGSTEPDYINLMVSGTEIYSFSNNTLLERLEMQNLKKTQELSLNLEKCTALKYLDASGSSFNSYSFANGGLLTVAKLGNPESITLRNLSYLNEENFVLDSVANLKRLTIDNCPLIDTFSRVQALDNLLLLNLLNVNWQVQGAEFDVFVNHIKNIPDYLITGEVKLTPEMGTFNIGDLGDTFTKDLKFYYYNINDPEAVPQPYHTVSFYGLYGNDFIRNQYIPSGGKFIGNNFEDYFTEQYIKNYNIFKDSSWQEGADIRLGFGSWSVDPENPVVTDLDVYAEEGAEYKLTYIMHTSDPEVFLSDRYFYYKEGDTITKLVTSEIIPFVRDYYKYTGSYWTATDNRESDPTASQTEVPAIATKEPYAETWYAVYQKSPNIYTISVYNTDREGNKQGEPLITLSKKVVSTINSENRVSYNELRNYRPGIGDLAKNKAIYINDTTMYQNDLEQEKEEDRLYRFLDWKPYIATTTGIQVTGDMDILATYYKKDDVFTNYFLNKLTDCTLRDDIEVLPEGAFLHNSNLTKLTTKATNIGKGSFSYFINNTRRIFIFTNNNVTFDEYCFYNLNNCLVIFTGTGSINVNNCSFDGIRNCTIIIQNSDEPIHTNGSLFSCFSNFYGNNNTLYVTANAYNRYRINNVNDYIPNNLNGQESYLSIINIIDNNNIKGFLEEAGLE